MVKVSERPHRQIFEDLGSKYWLGCVKVAKLYSCNLSLFHQNLKKNEQLLNKVEHGMKTQV